MNKLRAMFVISVKMKMHTKFLLMASGKLNKANPANKNSINSQKVRI